MSKLKTANALIDRAGEGTAFVAKQFAFEQGGRDGGAIDLDLVVVAPRAEIMDDVGD